MRCLTPICSSRGPQRLSRRRMSFDKVVGGGFGRPPLLNGIVMRLRQAIELEGLFPLP